MSITVTLDGGLDKYAEDLEERATALAEELIWIGKDKAEKKLESALYTGTKNVKFLMSTADGKTTLYAYGPGAAFIEFGTGVDETGDISDWHPLFHLMPPRGSYGKGKGANPPWYYKGDPGNNGTVTRLGWVRAWGDPANRFMYDASALMRKLVVKTAKEVFKK